MINTNKQRCFFCGIEKELSSFDNEHIIPNAIGGRLKSKKIVCKTCNNFFGHKLETALSSQFSSITSILNIKRQRKRNPTIELKTHPKNDAYLIMPGGIANRKVKIRKVGEKRYIFHFRTNEEYENLKQKAGKGKELVSEEKISEGKIGEIHSFETLKFLFTTGDGTSYRAIAKIAVCFYLHYDGNPELIQHVSGYIAGTYAGNIVFPFHPDFYISDIPSEVNLQHTIVIQGSIEMKRLWAYVELFGSFSYAVILNSNYKGPEYFRSYAINVANGNQIDSPEELSFNLSPPQPMHRHELEKMIAFSRERWKFLGKIISRKLIQNSIGKVLGKDFFGYKAGTLITIDIANNISDLLFTEIEQGETYMDA